MSFSILNVFMCGTDGIMSQKRTYIEILASACEAQNITNRNAKILPTNSNFKMLFDGCGVYGTKGVIFAFGLKELQVPMIVERVDEILHMGVSHLAINCFGLSRGGCGLCYLIKSLVNYNAEKVSINACIFDPVPGNLILSSSLDMCKFTTANQCLDLSSSKVLKNVLALYPHEPLPDLSFHAPLLIKYPLHCEVEEDVVLGCHQGAIFPLPGATESALSFYLISNFMMKHGTIFKDQFDFKPNFSEKDLLMMLDDEVREGKNQRTHREAHNSTYFSGKIVRNNEGKYLNKTHEKLSIKLNREATNGNNHDSMPLYMLELKRNAVFPIAPSFFILALLSSISAIIATSFK